MRVTRSKTYPYVYVLFSFFNSPIHPYRSHDVLDTHIHSSQTMAILSAWPRDYILRQAISISSITIIGIHILYFLFAGLSYKFIFNHDMMKHPRFLKNQVWLEIQSSLQALPVMTLLTLPIFLAEVRGHSMLYSGLDTYGYCYLIASIPMCVGFSCFGSCLTWGERHTHFSYHLSQIFRYLLFTDYAIYWIHRWLHIPVIYKYIHKSHHRWISKLSPYVSQIIFS